MAVVQVVDDPNIVDGVVLFQVVAHGDHVLRLATPAAVVVDADLAADGLGFGQKGQQTFRCGFDLCLLCFARVLHHDPELRVQFVFLKQPERLVMSAPERKELDAMLLIRQDLAFKLGDMLLPPVVGDFFDAHLRHHLGAGFGGALRGVKGHDAPRGEVLFVEEVSGRQRVAQAGHEQKGMEDKFHRVF